MTQPAPAPRTAAGRATFDTYRYLVRPDRILACILAIEAEAAAPAEWPPLNVESFIAGLDNQHHSAESRRAWIALFYRDMERAAAPAGLDVERLADAWITGYWACRVEPNLTQQDADTRGRNYARLAGVTREGRPAIESVMGNGDGTIKVWLSDGTTRTITEAEYLAWPRAGVTSEGEEGSWATGKC